MYQTVFQETVAEHVQAEPVLRSDVQVRVERRVEHILPDRVCVRPYGMHYKRQPVTMSRPRHVDPVWESAVGSISTKGEVLQPLSHSECDHAVQYMHVARRATSRRRIMTLYLVLRMSRVTTFYQNQTVCFTLLM